MLAEQGLTADKLCAYPWIVPPPQTTLRQQVDSFFVRHGLSLPTQRIETLSLALGLHYTLIGEAIWVAPEEAVRSAQQREELYELTLPLELNGGSVGLCINRSLHPTIESKYPDAYINMGMTAENLANSHQISRSSLELFAASSHKKAINPLA